LKLECFTWICLKYLVFVRNIHFCHKILKFKPIQNIATRKLIRLWQIQNQAYQKIMMPFKYLIFSFPVTSSIESEKDNSSKILRWCSWRCGPNRSPAILLTTSTDWKYSFQEVHRSIWQFFFVVDNGRLFWMIELKILNLSGLSFYFFLSPLFHLQPQFSSHFFFLKQRLFLFLHKVFTTVIILNIPTLSTNLGRRFVWPEIFRKLRLKDP